MKTKIEIKKKKEFTNDEERIMLHILMAEAFDNRNDSQNQRKFCHVRSAVTANVYQPGRYRKRDE